MNDSPSSTPKKRVADPNHPAYRVENEGQLAPRDLPRWLSRPIEGIKELGGELVLGGTCIAVFAGAVALFKFGWSHNREATAVTLVVVFGFLAYGAVHLTRGLAARPQAKPLFPRIAVAASVVLLAVILVMSYAMQYW